MNRKVLFIIPTLNPGGIETYLLRFLRYLNANIEVTVLIRNHDKGELLKSYQSTGVDLVFKPLGYLSPFKMLWYYKFFKKKSFDVICDFNANFAGLSLRLARFAGIKQRLAFYRQGKDHFQPSLFRNNYNNWSKKLVYNNATQILSNSKASLDFFFPEWQKDDRFKVIYNGIDASPFQEKTDRSMLRNQFDIPLDAFVVGHAGRLDPAKNHQTILKVAKKLIDRNNDIYFVLCGLNTEKLMAEAQTLGIDNNVRFLGYRNDVPNVLKTFDAFYFPSITEGQPNSLIEAILSGLPFVASDIKPIKEIIPLHLHQYLVGTFEVDEAVSKLEDIKNNKVSDVNSTQEWATGFFSPEKRFKEFLECLLKK